MQKSSGSTGLIVLLLLVLLAGCGREGRQEIEEKIVTSAEHVPPRKVTNGGNAVIRTTVKSTAPADEQSVVLYYRIGLDWTGLTMKPVGDEPVYEAEIPHQPRGTEVQYYIEVRTAAGSRLRLPPKAPDRLYVLSFQGIAPNWARIGHSLLLYSGLVLTLIAAVLAYLVIKGRSGLLSKIPFLVSASAVLYFVGGILLQMVVSWYVDARLWSGFPVGSNGDDTRSLVIVLFWSLIAFLTHTRLFRLQDESAVIRGNQLAGLVIGGGVLTLVLFLLPSTLSGS
jgi:hypothetical protein